MFQRSMENSVVITHSTSGTFAATRGPNNELNSQTRQTADIFAYYVFVVDEVKFEEVKQRS